MEPTIAASQLNPAERRLLDAVERRVPCDLTGETSRTIRAAVLRDVVQGSDVHLRGAEVDGAVDLREQTLGGAIRLEDCRLDAVVARGTQFSGGFRMTGCEVRGKFDAFTAAFTRDVWLDGSRFTGGASFQSASFHAGLQANGATFAGEVTFLVAHFGKLNTMFSDARFPHGVDFSQAKFESNAYFYGASFSRIGRFGLCSFHDVGFDRASFEQLANFDGAVFHGRATFREAFASTWSFAGAQFEERDPGPWHGEEVGLSEVVLLAPSRVQVRARTVVADRMQAREGVHLEVASSALDLTDSAFLRRSIVADLPPRPAVHESEPGIPPTGRTAASGCERAPAAEGRSREPTPLISLRGADVENLTLAGLALERCGFAGAHGLDRLRIDAGCTFGRAPRQGWGRLFTRRRILAEEAAWRGLHSRGWPQVTGGPPPPPAVEIAGLYRDLRKGLEDAKNEPGAADLYYGEMEMRRLAGRERATPGARTRIPPRSERWLLHAYWALSGYGLRASRAMAALAALILVSAWLFTSESFAVVPTNARSRGEAGFARPLEFATRETLSVLRGGSTLMETRGPGTVLDIALRLLGPVLLGLAVLAVRGRTKR